MHVRIDREGPPGREVDGVVLFHGRDEAGAAVVVALDRFAWDSVRLEWSFDPLTGVERLARMGHWAMLGDQLVWRIDFI